MTVAELIAPENQGAEGVCRPQPGPIRNFHEQRALHARQQLLVNIAYEQCTPARAKQIALRLARAQMAAYPQYDSQFDPGDWDLVVCTTEEPRRKGGLSFAPGDVVLHQVRPGLGLVVPAEHTCWSMRRAVMCIVWPSYFTDPIEEA